MVLPQLVCPYPVPGTFTILPKHSPTHFVFKTRQVEQMGVGVGEDK